MSGPPPGPVAAIVLAGGRSSRLGGTPKAELVGERGTLVETAVDAVRAQGADTVVVVGPDPGISGVVVTREDPPFSGPAAAIAAGVRALRDSGAAWAFVVACDMPSVGEALPRLSAAASSVGAGAYDDADPEAWLARTAGDGRTQFLLGLFRLGSLRAATSGDLRDAPVKAITRRLRVAEVEVPQAAADDADTWDDVERLGLRAPNDGREAPARSGAATADDGAGDDAGAPRAGRPPRRVQPGPTPADKDRPGAHADEPGWREAGALVHARAFATPAPEEVPLAEAIGEEIARDVHSPIDVPHYASSAMDGFAVAGPPPWRLGAQDSGTVGRAEPIVTGGLVPGWAEGIVRNEYADVDDGQVALAPGSPASELDQGRHIRRAGRELPADGLVAPAGTRVTEALVAFAAVAGHDSLPLVPRVGVDLVLTGSEVVGSGIPAPGRVRDVFAPQLPSLLARLGGRAGTVTRIPDDAGLTRHALLDATAQVIVTTGGTGHSSADHVRSTLGELGADFVVSGLRLRPGHPSMLALLPSGVWVLGLPGNPLAAMTALLVLGRPLLAGLRGLSAPEPMRLFLGEDVPGAPVDRLVPVAPGPDGAWVTCDGAGPNMLRGLASAQALASIDPEGARAGDEVDAIRLPWA